MSPPSFLLLFIFATSVISHEFPQKAFRDLKITKVNKHKLSLIIQRLRLDDTRRNQQNESCPMFQSFSSCACEPTCNNPNPTCITCQSGCTCRNGFVRNSLRLCVLSEECPPTNLRRFELQPPRRLYEAVPIPFTRASIPKEAPTSEPISTTESAVIGDVVTVPLIVLRSGPTPPSAPPTLQDPLSDMIGAPSATPPPDFKYGPPGMNASKAALYENFLKQKRIMRALRHRRTRLAKKLL